MLDVFLLHCLLHDSPPDSPEEIAAIGRNQNRVAARGREAGLKLERRGKEVSLHDWASELLAECEPIAAALDTVHTGTAYGDALRNAVAALADPQRLPSAHVLAQMQEHYANSHVGFTLDQSQRHADAIKHMDLDAAVEARFTKLAADSLRQQKQIEEGDTMPFEIYRQRYLAPERLNAMPIKRSA
jgi:glutamate--cysteine ligase